MPHKCLPKGKTPEQLAQIIKDYSAEDPIQHTEKIPLSPERIQELEHKSSAASRALDQLNKVKETFMNFLKNGTTVNPNSDAKAPEFMPETVTIPPTKGIKILTANREYADALISDGCETIVTPVYLIPWADQSKMVAVDIEGNEFEGYTRDMTAEEQERFEGLFRKDKKS